MGSKKGCVVWQKPLAEAKERAAFDNKGQMKILGGNGEHEPRLKGGKNDRNLEKMTECVKCCKEVGRKNHLASLRGDRSGKYPKKKGGRNEKQRCEESEGAAGAEGVVRRRRKDQKGMKEKEKRKGEKGGWGRGKETHGKMGGTGEK